MKTTDTNKPATIDNKSGKLLPTPKKIDLATIDDVRLEMANVYRGMKAGIIEASDGTKLAYVLAQIGKAIETHNNVRTFDSDRKLTPLSDSDFLG